MFLVEAQLKRGVSARQVLETRKNWGSEGKQSKLEALCSGATRHVVVGSSPQRVLWLLKTNRRSAANLIEEHFGRIWEIKVSQVKTQTIGGAIGERGKGLETQ